MTDDARTRWVESDGVRLHVTEQGDPAAPTVLLVHGYPDSSRVWRRVVPLLEDRFHVVTPDVRGAGGSDAPSDVHAYTLERLVADLTRVMDAVSPDRPVHLVGHDWGSIQSWEAVTDERLRGRIASFTSISGPCLDHAGWWLRQRRHGGPRDRTQVLGQLARSWYIAAFQAPRVPELVWRSGALRRGRRRPPGDGRTRDGVAGLNLYRANLARWTTPPRERRTDVPVQLVVPRSDAFVSPHLFDDTVRWAPRLWRRDVAAGHWVIRTHPEATARWITEFLDHVGGEPAPRRLRRAAVPALGTTPAKGQDTAAPFRDRLAVVTGAGSGIGRATAFALAEQGVTVVAADIDGAAAARTAELAGLLGPAAVAHTVDVSDRAAMERFAAAVLADLGVPDIVVNNAGIGMAGPVLDTTPEDWERILGVNLWGVIHGCRLFAPAMSDAREGGHIVNVASGMAYFPSRALPAYSTTKAAVLMFSQCLRAELAGAGVGVSAICPGFVETGITRATTFVGVDAATQETRREQATAAYQRRSYPPERVAAQILAAIRSNRAVVPVTTEARVGLALSRLSPTLLRALGRIDFGRNLPAAPGTRTPANR